MDDLYVPVGRVPYAKPVPSEPATNPFGLPRAKCSEVGTQQDGLEPVAHHFRHVLV